MDPKDKSPNVAATMRTAALALHELYLSYKEAGFSESQAFALVMAQVTSVASRPTAPQEET
jgi:hypothetical protein